MGRLGDVDEVIAGALGPAIDESEAFNDAIRMHLEDDEMKRARDTLFGVLLTVAVGSLVAVSYEARLRAQMLGHLSAAEEAEGRSVNENLSFAKIPFTEALDAFKARQLVTQDEFREMDEQARRGAFYMAGLQQRQALEAVHAELAKVMAEGGGRREWRQRADALFDDLGLSRETPRQLDLVYTNACQGAWNDGRYAQMSSERMLRRRPYWQYRTAGDNAVRLAHQAMHKRVFPADSEVWRIWWPQNGHGCRCKTRSLSWRDVQRLGLTVETEMPTVAEVNGKVVQILPDPGWSGSPVTRAEAQRISAALGERVQKSGALQPPRLTGTVKPGQAEAKWTGAEDLMRSKDRERARKVDTFAQVEAAEVKSMLEQSPAVSVYPAELKAPGRGEVAVDWHHYTQDLDSAEQLAERLLQDPGLAGLAKKGRLEAGTRATYRRNWPAGDDSPEVVLDPELGRELGDAGPVARMTEVVLRVRAKSGRQAQALARLVMDHGMRGPGRRPVRRAMDVADIRVSAGEGAALPRVAGYVEAWLTRLTKPKGARVLTRSAVDETSEKVMVPEGLLEKGEIA